MTDLIAIYTHGLSHNDSDLDGINWDRVYSEFNRKQRRIMAKDSMTTKRQFMAESPAERAEFVRWMLSQ